MAAEPEVSVIIPTHERAGLVVAAVLSALEQRDVEVEVIVVDDGSRDGTQAALAAVADARLKVLRHPTSRGVASARNTAAAAARGRWIAFLDDDDLWAPGWLRSAIDAAERVGAGFVVGSRWLVDVEGRARHVALVPPPDGLFDGLRRVNTVGGPSSVVTERAVLEAAGGFDVRLHALADWELWMRLLARTTPAVVAEPLVGYTQYRDNMHLRDPWSVLREHDVLALELWSHPGGPAERDWIVRWLARESEAFGSRRTAMRLWAEALRRSGDVRDAGRMARAIVSSQQWAPGAFAAPTWVADFRTRAALLPPAVVR